MSNIQLTTLPGGLRVISDYVPDVESVAIGVWVGVGTRHEAMSENGIAHMVEHMLFKGTKTRDAQKIAEDIENVGGNFNAYTSREITSYHIHLLKEDAALAMEVLSDMVQHSTLPDEEIERERQVIVQEIGMNNDTPDDLIFDQSYERAFHGQTMGAPILGQVKIIENMKKSSLQNFINAYYTQNNIVISAAGNLTHDQLVELTQNYFNALPQGSNAKYDLANYTGGDLITEKDLEQAHIILGFEGLKRDDDLYYPTQAYSSILGGGMSSRLFQEVREKRGLAYSIFSFHSGHTDSGFFGIYSGCSPNDLNELTRVLCEEIVKSTDTITEEELAKAKSQLKANILMGRESMMRRADQHAKHLILSGNLYAQQEVIKKINNISRTDIKNAAEKIFSSQSTLCTLGPKGHADNRVDITKAMAA